MSKIAGSVYKSPVANSVPYDDTIQLPLSGTSDVQAMLDYLKNLAATSSSPGYTWGGSGNIPANSWLINDTVPSNLSGRTIFISAGTIVKVYVANQLATSGIVLGVYEHTGDNTGMTLIGTVTTAAQRSNIFVVSWAVTTGKQLAIKIEAGSASAKNVVVGVQLKGSLT